MSKGVLVRDKPREEQEEIPLGLKGDGLDFEFHFAFSKGKSPERVLS